MVASDVVARGMNYPFVCDFGMLRAPHGTGLGRTRSAVRPIRRRGPIRSSGGANRARRQPWPFHRLLQPEGGPELGNAALQCKPQVILPCRIHGRALVTVETWNRTDPSEANFLVPNFGSPNNGWHRNALESVRRKSLIPGLFPSPISL